MSRRAILSFVVVLLCIIGAAVWWRLGERQPTLATTANTPAEAAAPGTSPSQPTGSAGVAASANVTNAAPTIAATADKYAKYRLSNTTLPFKQLLRKDTAVILENARLDTASPLDLPIPAQLRAKGDPGAYVVVARGPIDNAFHAALRAAGVTEVYYIPNNAWLVRATAAQVAALTAQPNVQAAVAFEPYYKLKSSLLRLAVEQQPLPAGESLNLVLFADAEAATMKALRSLGISVTGTGRSPFGPVVTVAPQPDDLATLAGLTGVQLIERAAPRVAANDLARVTMGLAPDTLTTNNYFNLTGSGVLVAVVDSGIDITHPDLTGRVLLNSPDAGTDTEGHGTHVASIIAGDGTQSSTVGTNAPGSVEGASYQGKAPGAKLFSLLSHDTNAFDYGFFAYAQQQIAQTNALIANNSWGLGGDYDYDIAAANYDAAVRDALPFQPGSQPVTFVFSAGNDGDANDGGLSGVAGSIVSPSTGKNVITVGALEQLRGITNKVTMPPSTNEVAPWAGETDSANQVAGYSSRGNVGIGVEGDYGRFKPDVVAPGTFVVAARSAQWDTGAYYSITNTAVRNYSDLVLDPHALNQYSISLPADAVGLTINVTAHPIGTNAPLDLPIYLKQGDFASTNAGGYDITKTNSISLPADGPVTSGTSYFYAVVNPTNISITFDIKTTLIYTNNLVNYYAELKKLNDALGGSYRYETGTSMAAPAVSGTLALMEEFYERLGHTNSPALMKALLINGARSASTLYDLQVQSTINHQGWGLVNLPTSLPPTSNSVAITDSSFVFFDQDPTNALATGESATRTVKVSNPAQSRPLRFSLVWTDPPGNPAAGVKLVNDLDLIVTNLDSGAVYFGNDFQTGSDFTTAWDTNSTPNLDSINNVENIYLSKPFGTNFTVTVRARRVNVNAVTAHTNNVVQDYALVISSGNGEVTNALQVVQSPVTTGPSFNLTVVTNTTAAPLLNQTVGANSPLILGANGVTNQWHFYAVTNYGTNANFTNAAFITFLPPTLSVPRLGPWSPISDEISKAEGDIDMYVSMDARLTNLDVAVLGNTNLTTRSVGRGGTEIVTFTNSAPGDVYYIGIKAEDQMAGQYGFFALFSDVPFSERDADGNLIVHGFPSPVQIPDGTPKKPGAALVFGIATEPVKVRQVTVTNTLTHQNFGDLLGNLSHNNDFVVLNNHSFGNGALTQTRIYDDSGQGGSGAQKPDGPGSLQNFIGAEGIGLWLLTEIDDSPSQTGRVDNLTIKIAPQDILGAGDTLTIEPGGWGYTYVDVPPEATNLTISVDNISASPGPVDVYIRRGDLPDFNNYDKKATVLPPGSTNALSISKADIPPLQAGTYYIGVFNPNLTVQKVVIKAHIDTDITGITPFVYTSTNSVPLLDDAVTNAFLFVTNDQKIIRAEVGVRLNHPRVSDLALQLVSPDGKRVLLFENRGGTNADGLGSDIQATNVFSFGSGVLGGTNAFSTNLDTSVTAGTVRISYDFQNIPDSLTVYYESNAIYPLTWLTNAGTIDVTYSGASTVLTFVVNENGNPDTNTFWSFDVTTPPAGYNYAVFTEDTNKSPQLLKFATPPFFTRTAASNVFFNGFEGAVAGTYALGNSFDGWTVDANQVDVIGNPTQAGLYSLALENGTVSTTLPTTVGSVCHLSFYYRLTNSLDINGGFETPPASATYSAGQTFGGWTVQSGDVDHVSDGGWQPAEGMFSMDLNGSTGVGFGVIYRDVPTIPGQQYLLSFAYAGNPAGGPAVKTMNVSWDGAGLGSLSFDTTGFALTNMGWTYTNYVVVGTGTNRLQFASTVAGDFGPTLDDVRLIPIGSARVSVGAEPPVVVTGSTAWQQKTITFIATTNATDLVVQSLADGLIVDSFSLDEDVLLTSNYLPEESLDTLKGDNAKGKWTLEIWDSRVGATNPAPELLSWNLSFILEEPELSSVTLDPFVNSTNTVTAGSIQYLIVDVPPWASAATNSLLGVLNTNLPLLVWFNQTGAPQGTNPPDFGFFGGAAVTSGVEVLTTNSVPPVPVLLPGQRYYLGVQNTNAVDLTYVFRVDFDITALTNGVPYVGVSPTNSGPRFFAYDVTTNATAVQFALTNLDGDLNLVASRGHLPNAFGSYDYGSFQPGTNDEQILVFPSSTPVALAPGTWFLGVYPATSSPVNYTIVATELTNTFPNIITLTNQVPYAAVNTGPSGTADYYRYSVSTSAARLQLEIFGATGDFTLVAHKGLPLPDLATFNYRSANPGTNDELIVITTNSGPVTLTSGDWFITAVKISAGAATYNIMATEATVTGQPISVTGAPDGFGDFCITWSSVPNAHYLVETTPILAPPAWVDASGPITAFDYTTTWCTPMTNGMQFYRVVEGISLSASTTTNLTVSTVQVAPGGVTLTWYGDLNATYQVQWTDTLFPATWTTVATNITSTTGIFTFLDDGTLTPPLGAMRFYRLLLP